jgi:hypothetical protein
MLRDFFDESPLPEGVEADLMVMRDAPSTAELYCALKSIICKMGRQRHKRVPDACMLLVIREMRDIVLERLGRLSPDRLELKPTSTPSPNGAARP